MYISNEHIADSIAKAIYNAIENKTDKRITHSTFAVSFQLHVALEAIAKELNINVADFKRDCGVGQPLAYFI